MSEQEIFDKIKEVLIDDFEVEENLITKDASFYDDMGLDSLDAIDLIVNLNNIYNIDVENKEIEETRTIAQLMNVVQKNLSK
ncbi:MAG: acyl carrier protein [Sulfurovaceae bacterium]|nr:acyl carrier protein [Sulfurovaceae bacterium]